MVAARSSKTGDEHQLLSREEDDGSAVHGGDAAAYLRSRNRAEARCKIRTTKMELYWVKVGLNVARRWSRADGEDEELSR